METQERTLRELLSKQASQQKKSYRRATLLVVIVALIGGGWLAFSAINVTRLEGKADQLMAQSLELKQKIDDQNRELETKKEELKKIQEELDDRLIALVEADKNLREIETKLIAGRPKEALQVASKAIKSNAKVTKDGTTAPGLNPGFTDNNHYEGPARTVISVVVIPDQVLLDSPKRPGNLYTYELNGKNYLEPPTGNTITFSLDSTKHLKLILDFARGERGGYTIRQRATAGSKKSSTFRVGPPKKGASTQVELFFSVK